VAAAAEAAAPRLDRAAHLQPPRAAAAHQATTARLAPGAGAARLEAGTQGEALRLLPLQCGLKLLGCPVFFLVTLCVVACTTVNCGHQTSAIMRCSVFDKHDTGL
jgi:hypothetical protein